MRDYELRKLRSIECVLEFFRLFPDPTPAVLAVLARLKSIDIEVRALIDEELVARQVATMALESRNAIGASLRTGLSHLGRLAATAAIRAQQPELNLRVSVKAIRRRDFPGTVRAVFATAATQQAMLLLYGMPAKMLDDLTRQLDRYDEALERRANAVATCARLRADATAKTHETIHLIRHLDVLTQIRFKGDENRLAEWRAALSLRAESSANAGREEEATT